MPPHKKKNYSHLVWETFEGRPCRRSLLCGFEAADDVLQRRCHHKIFLLQTKFFSFEELKHRLSAVNGWKSQMYMFKGKYVIVSALISDVT